MVLVVLLMVVGVVVVDVLPVPVGLDVDFSVVNLVGEVAGSSLDLGLRRKRRGRQPIVKVVSWCMK